MIISVWRYSHLALAVSSFLLLILASVSGIILAFEPVMEKSKGYKADGFDTIHLSTVIPVVKQKHKSVQQLQLDDNGYVSIKHSDEKGSDKQFYIDPVTATILADVPQQKPLFKWMTSLHRSLFLHETGRWIMGVTAFLLLLIAISGIGLLAKRQQGIRNFFKPIEKTGFAQYYHVVFGRFALFFIMAIALTGTYLSASRFFVAPSKASMLVKEEDLTDEPELELSSFPFLQQTKLSQVKTIDFPFSDFPEDYYTIKLKDKEVCLNQFNGKLLAQQLYPPSQQLADFSMRWHTGRSAAIWAIVLAISALYILFFIYSGFAISIKRWRSQLKNKYKAKDSRIVILFGSENGSTLRFATAVYKQLVKHGEKVFITDLDNYQSFPQAEQIIVMASTYGDGDAPSNAKKIEQRLVKYPQVQSITYSVLAFGSRSYQHYCRFGYKVDHLFQHQAWAVPLMEIVTVNEQSPQDFNTWLTAWTKETGISIMMPRELLAPNQQHLRNLTVVNKTDVDADNAFLVQLKSKRFSPVVSGDLLAIYPKNDHRERLYSIGNVNGNIQLSVKLHEHGLGSGFLHGLQQGQGIQARIIKNQHFHFPARAKQVIMIANGTGIAPFLGMIDENKKQVACTLFCGFRTSAAYELYRPFLDASIAAGKLKELKLALSREGAQQYVGHLLLAQKDWIASQLQNASVFMICGSLAMQKDVLAVLDEICRLHQFAAVETLLDEGRILTDCY